ncbi:MAG: PIN domain-containing protein [Candidatus Methanoperedens sp.]|nr:PIN domain-containing protein [Candidatus Methanoperedens sp.]
MRNELSGFKEGPVFIDANIFVYHATDSKYTESATAFLEKVENNEIEAFTSPSVVDEAAYVLIINKGLEILDSKSPRKVREKLEKDRKFAQKCYSVLKDFIGYVKSLETLKLLEITGDDAFRIYDYGTAYLLHPKDALHLAVMKRYRIFDIATNDGDFERVEWVRVWSP